MAKGDNEGGKGELTSLATAGHSVCSEKVQDQGYVQVRESPRPFKFSSRPWPKVSVSDFIPYSFRMVFLFVLSRDE